MLTAKALELIAKVEARERRAKIARLEEDTTPDALDRLNDKFGSTSVVYRDISSGTENGRCTTRRGTYLRYKRMNQKG